MPSFKKPNDINVGVVGYGGAFNMGRNHLNEMKRAGMTPAAVADIDAARRAVAVEEFPGIRTFETLDEMLDGSDVNLITIITPHDTHAELALKALKAGRSVVCEKPLAITTEECDRMIAAADKSGVVLSTYHNRHWDGCIMEAVKRIRRKGEIGDVVRIEAHMGGYAQPRDWWRTSRSIAGSVLHDWGVHLLEYGLQLIDSPIREVSGFFKTGFWGPRTAWGDDAIEDEGFATVRFASGQWMTLCITSIDSKPKAGQLEITGTKGTYTFDHRTWEIIAPKKGKTIITRGESPRNEGWRLYQNVADHLVKGEPLVITGEWARRPIHILDLACRSGQSGKAMKAKYE